MGQAKKGSKLIYVWWANLATNLPIVAAVTGFVYAIVLLILQQAINSQHTINCK